MQLRFGTRTIIKSLLIAAGIPSLVAAQAPVQVPGYQQPIPAQGQAFPGYQQPVVARPSEIATAAVHVPQNVGAGTSSGAIGGHYQIPVGTTSPPALPASTGYSLSDQTAAVPAVANNRSLQAPNAFPTRLASFPASDDVSTAEATEAASVSETSELKTKVASYPEPVYNGPIVGSQIDYSCNGLPWCEGPANSGCFVSLEALSFFVNKPTAATFGDVASERVVTVNGISYQFENSLDSSWLANDAAWGQRLEFGNIKGDCGWYASLWNVKQVQEYTAQGVSFIPSDPSLLMSGFVDSNGDGFDDDLNGNDIYGRSGEDIGYFDPGPPAGFIPTLDGRPDIPAPIDGNDALIWNQTFATVTSSNKLTIANFELNRLVRLPGYSWNHEIDYYYGVRYMKVRDIYNITANGGFLDQSFWNAESDNNLIGPQVGLRWSKRAKAIGFSVDGRFLAAYNRQDNDLRGSTGTNIVTVGAPNGPSALTAESFLDGFGNDAFSPAGELRADMVLKISRSLGFKVGYTGVVMGEISRASPKIVYALPRSSLQDVESDTTLISHGVNFGIEYNR